MGFHTKFPCHVSCKKADVVIQQAVWHPVILGVEPSKHLLRSWIRLCFLWENRVFIALRLEVTNSLPTNLKNSRPSLSTTISLKICCRSCALNLASHVDVLRLVTWEERVTSLRSSAWEANTAVDRPALHLSNRLDKSPS